MEDPITRSFIQTAVFMTVFWGVSGLVFGYDYVMDTPDPEWNAYPPKRRSQIIYRVLVNHIVGLTLWALFYNFLSLYYTPIVVFPLWVKIIAVPVGADVCFYVLHSIVHLPVLFKHTHKMHHEIKKPFCVGSMYCGFIELWGVNLLSGSLPLFLLGASPLEVTAFMCITSADTVIAHSKWSANHHTHHTNTKQPLGTSLGFVDWCVTKLSSST